MECKRTHIHIQDSVPFLTTCTQHPLSGTDSCTRAHNGQFTTYQHQNTLFYQDGGHSKLAGNSICKRWGAGCTDHMSKYLPQMIVEGQDFGINKVGCTSSHPLGSSAFILVLSLPPPPLSLSLSLSPLLTLQYQPIWHPYSQQDKAIVFYEHFHLISLPHGSSSQHLFLLNSFRPKHHQGYVIIYLSFIPQILFHHKKANFRPRNLSQTCNI